MDHGARAGSEEVKVASMTEVRDRNEHKQSWVGSDYEGLEHLRVRVHAVVSHLDLYYGYRKYFLVLAVQKQTETVPPHEHQTRHYACLGDAPRES